MLRLDAVLAIQGLQTIRLWEDGRTLLRPQCGAVYTVGGEDTADAIDVSPLDVVLQGVPDAADSRTVHFATPRRLPQRGEAGRINLRIRLPPVLRPPA